LENFGIVLTIDTFNSCICGNSDETAMIKIIPHDKYDNNYNIQDISNRKDELFIKNISKIRIIDGVHDFLKNIKCGGHKMAIVTNCNRRVAEEIVKYLGIAEYFEFIIVGNECSRPKPYSDPYTTAIAKFNASADKTIIFEDSKSGILSAKGTFPKCLVGITTIYSETELKQNGVNIVIKNYCDLNMEYLLEYKSINSMNIDTLKQNIIKSLSGSVKHKIKDIYIDGEKLKGGFISDVIALKITTESLESPESPESPTQVLDCVLKLENKSEVETFLSKMSHELGLYEREYYFYDVISKHVPVNYPEFYGLIKDDEGNNIGILMKNLLNEGYKVGLDLNSNKIDISLKIIEYLAKMHTKFWESDKNDNSQLQQQFPKLRKNNDEMFNPKWDNFIKSRWGMFKGKWQNILSNEQLTIGEYIVANFGEIQEKLSDKNLTLCHGDVKSANIFYKKLDSNNSNSNKDDYEPYFIDWQYIIMGKGVQDLVFFMIESFEIETMKLYKTLFKEYYYVKLIENGVKNYSKDEYSTDFNNAAYYFPFFVAIWFGTLNEDELIDKTFPRVFIQKLFAFY
jgi:HAD superfamily hydrolase (TIGR01509 family)